MPSLCAHAAADLTPTCCSVRIAAVLSEWITALRGALAVGRDLPAPPPGVPSPFSLADKGFATDVLTRAGFSDVAFEDSVQPFNVGSDADDAYGFVAGLQPVVTMVAISP